MKPKTISISDLLQILGFPPADYEHIPLGSNIDVFHLLQNFLKGKLETFGPDFIPPGYRNPNYVPLDRGKTILIYGLTSLFATVCVVTLRLFTRSFLSAGGPVRRASDEERTRPWWKFWPWWVSRLRFGPIGYDDWAVIPAVILLAGYTAINVLGVTRGAMGRHVYDATLVEIRLLMKTIFAHTIVYLTFSLFIKLSILLFYSRLAGPISIKMQWAIRGLFAIIFIYTIVGIFKLSFVCHPVKAFYTIELRGQDGSCPEQKPLETAYTSILVLHVSSDFLVLMLPIKLVWSIQLPIKQKILCSGLFGAGILACVASIMRLYYFPRINRSLDVTWNIVDIALWGQVEASTAVITASLPALKSLFSGKARQKLRSRSMAGAGAGDNSINGPLCRQKNMNRKVLPADLTSITIDIEYGVHKNSFGAQKVDGSECPSTASVRRMPIFTGNLGERNGMYGYDVSISSPSPMSGASTTRAGQLLRKAVSHSGGRGSGAISSIDRKKNNQTKRISSSLSVSEFSRSVSQQKVLLQVPPFFTKNPFQEDRLPSLLTPSPLLPTLNASPTAASPFAIPRKPLPPLPRLELSTDPDQTLPYVHPT